MKLSSVEAIVEALARENVRYLVAGGLAVNAHGCLRFTKDIDVVLQLDAANVHAAFLALSRLGYTPNVPVSADQFADTETRESWIREKGMQVLQFWSDGHLETPVDVFAAEPFDFDMEYERALVKRLNSFSVRFVCLTTLIRMKELAGRDQDLLDVANLKLRSEGRER